MSQKVLMMSTCGNDLRSDVDSWSMEDSDLVRWTSRMFPGDAPIGLTPGVTGKKFPATPLHALNLGWKLLAPPAPIRKEDETLFKDDKGRVYYDWWFVRDEW
jgi:hypothetical protein